MGGKDVEAGLAESLVVEVFDDFPSIALVSTSIRNTRDADVSSTLWNSMASLEHFFRGFTAPIRCRRFTSHIDGATFGDSAMFTKIRWAHGRSEGISDASAAGYPSRLFGLVPWARR